MRYGFLLLVISFFFAGCNQGEHKSVKMINDTYHTIPTGYTSSNAGIRKSREERKDNYKKELELAKLKSEENLKMAKIEAEAKEEVKRIESEALKAKVVAAKEVHLHAQKTQKEIAASKEQRLAQTKEKDLFFYMIVTAVIAAMILIALLVWYLMHRKNKAIELKMHEDKLRHDAAMEAGRQHHEKIGRVLEIIADESANEQVRHKLIDILRDQTISENLIEYQPEDEPKEDGDVQDGDVQDAEDTDKTDEDKKTEG